MPLTQTDENIPPYLNVHSSRKTETQKMRKPTTFNDLGSTGQFELTTPSILGSTNIRVMDPDTHALLTPPSSQQQEQMPKSGSMLSPPPETQLEAERRSKASQLSVTRKRPRPAHTVSSSTPGTPVPLDTPNPKAKKQSRPSGVEQSPSASKLSGPLPKKVPFNHKRTSSEASLPSPARVSRPDTLSTTHSRNKSRRSTSPPPSPTPVRRSRSRTPLPKYLRSEGEDTQPRTIWSPGPQKSAAKIKQEHPWTPVPQSKRATKGNRSRLQRLSLPPPDIDLTLPLPPASPTDDPLLLKGKSCYSSSKSGSSSKSKRLPSRDLLEESYFQPHNGEETVIMHEKSFPSFLPPSHSSSPYKHELDDTFVGKSSNRVLFRDLDREESAPIDNPPWILSDPPVPDTNESSVHQPMGAIHTREYDESFHMHEGFESDDDNEEPMVFNDNQEITDNQENKVGEEMIGGNELVDKPQETNSMPSMVQSSTTYEQVPSPTFSHEALEHDKTDNENSYIEYTLPLAGEEDESNTSLGRIRPGSPHPLKSGSHSLDESDDENEELPKRTEIASRKNGTVRRRTLSEMEAYLDERHASSRSQSPTASLQAEKLDSLEEASHVHAGSMPPASPGRRVSSPTVRRRTLSDIEAHLDGQSQHAFSQPANTYHPLSNIPAPDATPFPTVETSEPLMQADGTTSAEAADSMEISWCDDLEADINPSSTYADGQDIEVMLNKPSLASHSLPSPVDTVKAESSTEGGAMMSLSDNSSFEDSTLVDENSLEASTSTSENSNSNASASASTTHHPVLHVSIPNPSFQPQDIQQSTSSIQSEKLLFLDLTALSRSKSRFSKRLQRKPSSLSHEYTRQVELSAEDPTGDEDDVDDGLVKISSSDSWAAARAAAILKRHHDYEEDIHRSRIHAKRRLSQSPAREQKKALRLRDGVSKHKPKQLYSPLQAVGSPAQLRELLHAAEISVITESPARAPSVISDRFLSPRLSSLPPSSPGRSFIPVPGEWRKTDWKALDRCFSDERLAAGYLGIMAPPDDVDLNRVVDRFIAEVGSIYTNLGSEWSRDKLLRRVIALKERQRAGRGAPPTPSRIGQYDLSMQVPWFTPSPDQGGRPMSTDGSAIPRALSWTNTLESPMSTPVLPPTLIAPRYAHLHDELGAGSAFSSPGPLINPPVRRNTMPLPRVNIVPPSSPSSGVGTESVTTTPCKSIRGISVSPRKSSTPSSIPSTPSSSTSKSKSGVLSYMGSLFSRKGSGEGSAPGTGFQPQMKQIRPLMGPPALPRPPTEGGAVFPRGPIETPARPPIEKLIAPKDLVNLNHKTPPSHIPIFKKPEIPRRMVELNHIPTPGTVPRRERKVSTGSVKDIVKAFEEKGKIVGESKLRSVKSLSDLKGKSCQQGVTDSFSRPRWRL